MIHFDRVSKRYPNGHIGLHELSFRAERGEILFITGPVSYTHLTLPTTPYV